MSTEMKIDADALANEVAWLVKMPSSQSPVTALIQVTALLGSVMVRRTYFDQYQESTVPAEGVGGADILVDAAKLSAALKTVNGTITLVLDEEELTIRSNERTVRLRAATSFEFPKWPQFETITGKEAITCQQIVQALTSVGTDESIPQLMAVGFDEGTMVTTDRFRLTAVTFGPYGFVGKVASSALKAVSRGDTSVFIESGRCAGESADWIEIRDGKRIVTAPQPDTQFPKWRQLIPDSVPTQLAIERVKLQKAVSGEEVTIVISAEDATVTVLSESEGMKVEQVIQPYRVMKHEAETDVTVSLRSKYVNDVLKGIKSGVILLEVTAGDKPVVFRDIGERETHLVMPTRKQPAAVK